MEAPNVRRQLVLGGAALLILAQLAFRAWALYPSWFFTDDYRLMIDARRTSAPGLGYLFTPFDSQSMPGGRLLVWLVADSGTTNWTLAATLTLCLQLAASAACLWMLVTLFGTRWGTVGLLSIYLTSAIGMPALMWWAASLNQIPLQIAFFCTVGCGVRYMRHPGKRRLALTILSFGFGLLFYVKSVLLAPVLLLVVLLFFATGTPTERVRTVVRRYWPAFATAAVAGIAYASYYLAVVPSAFVDQSGPGKVGEVANAMLGTALPAGVLGGPWRWFDTSAPIVLAGPPDWAVHAAWVMIALIVSYSVLRRRRAWRGWALIAGYAVLLFVLLLTTRGQQYGGFAGLEYRYLSDMVCVVPLGLGLVFLELRGAVETSELRATPLITFAVSPLVWSGLTILVCGSAVVSSTTYVRFWHDDNAGRSYVKNLQGAVADRRSVVDLPSQTVPDRVMPAYTQPENDTRTFAPLVVDSVRFPRSSPDLAVINDDGTLSRAGIGGGPRSEPGSVPGCGRKLTSDPEVIPLDSRTFNFVWWMRIGYLSSEDSPITVRAGTSVIHTNVRRGTHSLFVQATGAFGDVGISDLAQGTTLCVDTVEVGQPVPVLEAR